MFHSMTNARLSCDSKGPTGCKGLGGVCRGPGSGLRGWGGRGLPQAAPTPGQSCPLAQPDAVWCPPCHPLVCWAQRSSCWAESCTYPQCPSCLERRVSGGFFSLRAPHQYQLQCLQAKEDTKPLVLRRHSCKGSFGCLCRDCRLTKPFCSVPSGRGVRTVAPGMWT